MLVFGFTTLDVGLWTTLAPLGAGAVVTSLVIGSALIYGRWRRRLSAASREEDLPWDNLLELLQRRNQERAATGLPPEEMTQEVLGELMAYLPSVGNARPLESPEDHEFRDLCGDDRRNNQRRWGNPTGVYLHSYLWSGGQHALVVNRSTGGIGIYMDTEVTPGMSLRVRPAESPPDIRGVRVEVRHCRQVGKGFFVGCEFTEDVPWNVRVWFG